MCHSDLHKVCEWLTKFEWSGYSDMLLFYCNVFYLFGCNYPDVQQCPFSRADLK